MEVDDRAEREKRFEVYINLEGRDVHNQLTRLSSVCGLDGDGKIGLFFAIEIPLEVDPPVWKYAELVRLPVDDGVDHDTVVSFVLVKRDTVNIFDIRPPLPHPDSYLIDGRKSDDVRVQGGRFRDGDLVHLEIEYRGVSVVAEDLDVVGFLSRQRQFTLI